MGRPQRQAPRAHRDAARAPRSGAAITTGRRGGANEQVPATTFHHNLSGSACDSKPGTDQHPNHRGKSCGTPKAPERLARRSWVGMPGQLSVLTMRHHARGLTALDVAASPRPNLFLACTVNRHWIPAVRLPNVILVTCTETLMTMDLWPLAEAVIW